MNRKRRIDESFEDYRKNLKKEQQELKRKLKGKILWPSATLGTAVRSTSTVDGYTAECTRA